MTITSSASCSIAAVPTSRTPSGRCCEDAALLAPEFAVGTLDAGLILAPENRPVVASDLASQEPFTAWLRRGIDRDRIFVEPKLYPSRGTAEAIREQSRQRFGRFRCAIERQRRLRL
jgi:hypothetical protein